MKITELRIGNWYMFADNEGICYRTIKEIKHNEFGFVSDFDGVNFGICKPIPLTEEWLLKFGFEITDNFQTKDRFQTHKQDGIFWFEYGYIVVELNYVHQLQNLYFALTGEELTIKNETL